MSPFLIGYLATVAIAFGLLVRRIKPDSPPDIETAEWVLACILAWTGPAVLVACLAQWRPTPRHIRQARTRAEVAELAAREAEAIAARERALGL